MHHILSLLTSYLSQDQVRSHSILNYCFLGSGVRRPVRFSTRGANTICGARWMHTEMTLVTFHIEGKHGKCTQSSARLIQPWSCTPNQPPCGTSDMNTWCHKCLRHNMHTLQDQEKKDLGRGWRVRMMEAGLPARLH